MTASGPEGLRFKLREGLKFHNGDPFTAEDVKFSFLRTKGAKILLDKVREVTIVDPYRVRFQLHEPFPDFMTYYGTFATGAGWIVPKKYFEQVGPDGFKKHPIGLGPYKFVSSTPGVDSSWKPTRATGESLRSGSSTRACPRPRPGWPC